MRAWADLAEMCRGLVGIRPEISPGEQCSGQGSDPMARHHPGSVATIFNYNH
jgi:hypothetical protein